MELEQWLDGRCGVDGSGQCARAAGGPTRLGKVIRPSYKAGGSWAIGFKVGQPRGCCW